MYMYDCLCCPPEIITTLFISFVLCCAESLSHVQFCNPMDCSLPGSSVCGNSPGKNTGVGLHALLQGSFPTQGLNPGFPLQADSLPAEPQGKPKNTGVGSLFLRQGIFLNQELNRGLLHWRQILYQLSFQGSRT